jgi:hypothetical protein
MNSLLPGVPPRRLFSLARLTLLLLILGGALLALILAAGAADPPLAGPPRYTAGPFPAVEVGPDTILDQHYPLPDPPYTLQVSALFSAGSDPLAWWSLTFDSGAAIKITSDAYFSLPPLLPDSISFFHIRPVGQTNEIYLNVEPSGAATLRIDREIAWQGNFPSSHAWGIRAGSGVIRGRLTVLRVTCFAPATSARKS